METVSELCRLLLDLEAVVGVLAHGLPKGADDESLSLVAGESGSPKGDGG